MILSAAEHGASRIFTDNVLYDRAFGMDRAEIAETLSCSDALDYNVLARMRGVCGEPVQ